jgi:CBS domain containing-hemolysin-like protein
MYVLGQLPAKGQVIELGDWQFKVIDLEGRRIDKVTAIPRQGGSGIQFQ